MQNSDIMHSLQDLSTGTIYLMGGSFVLGSLFTLLLLVLLDFRRKLDTKGKHPDA